MCRRIKLLLMLACVIALLSACSPDYSGQYGGMSDSGVFVSMTLDKNGAVETNILGMPVNGSYTIEGSTITVTLSAFGYGQSIQGRISNDLIEFADVSLKKGVTSAKISDIPGSQGVLNAAAVPVNSQSTDQISFSEPKLLSIICDQYGFDPSHVTQDDLLKVNELNINLVAKHIHDREIKNLSMVDLKYLPNLEILRIISNYELEVDLKGITHCKHLRILELKACRINDLERIGTLVNLEELSISSERGEGIVDYSPLKNLVSLKKLSLVWYGYNAYNRFYLKDASSISSLINLEELTISCVGIENYSLAGMPKLKKVELTHYDAITLFDELYESGAWHSLEHLSCHVKMDGVAMYKLTRLTNLKYLYLDMDVADGMQSLIGIDKLNQLETLIIPSISYKLVHTNEIGKISTLKVLEIRNDADYVPLDYINNLTGLTHLHLGTNGDIQLSKFSNLVNLETIEIYGVSGRSYIDLNGVSELKSLKEIKYYQYQIKSTMPLDDYPEIVLTKVPMTW